MERGYLLPEGCKDLNDVLKLKQKLLRESCKGLINVGKLNPKSRKCETRQQSQHHLVPLPPIVGEIVVPAQASALQLAELLGHKVFVIIADLMELGVFATAKQPLDFKAISTVARKHGYIAKKAE